MKRFDLLQLNSHQCRQELDALKHLLDSSLELKEQRDLMPFFKKSRQLSALIGTYNPTLNPDQLAYEYDIFGDFAADIVVGGAVTKNFCFIELEDATATSLFKQKAQKASLEWSDRFEHGYSQIIDWFWKLDDMESTDEFRSRLGDGATYQAVLIIGRSLGLDHKERKRLQWRRENVIVNSRQVHCVTYDELYQHLDSKLRLFGVTSSLEEDSPESDELDSAD